MNHSAPNRNLILTLVEKLTFSDIEPFFVSLRQTGYDGDLVVFASRLSADTIRRINQFGAQVISFSYFSVRYRRPPLLFWRIWRIVFSRMSDFDRKLKLAKKIFNLFFLRSILYYEYLEKHSGRYKRVLLTDCRDVLFQRDPFSRDYEIGWHAFLEGRDRTIGTCPWNRHMVTTCFGHDVLKALGEKEPSCAGVIIGNVVSVQNYLRSFVEKSFTLESMPMVPGTDQGVHNLIVHKHLAPNLRLHENGTASVLTMGVMQTDQIKVNDSDEVLNFDGTIPAVLHQYDRHPSIRKLLLKRLEQSIYNSANST